MFYVKPGVGVGVGVALAGRGVPPGVSGRCPVPVPGRRAQDRPEPGRDDRAVYPTIAHPKASMPQPNPNDPVSGTSNDEPKPVVNRPP